MKLSPGQSPRTLGIITEFSLDWPGGLTGSPHELAIDETNIYVTGQKMGLVAKCDHQGNVLEYFEMPAGSGPHGLLLDRRGDLWVSLEFAGQVVRLDPSGRIAEQVDVQIYPSGSASPINTAPHAIGLSSDGETIWFTGKRTSTVGRIHPDRSVEHFQLSNLGAVPIYLSAGPDGNVWGTELQSSHVFNVSPQGAMREFEIPTSNSRPIAIIADPDGPYMWFTEEAGVRVGKIDLEGCITEYTVPALQRNHILASLAFDREMNLWVQAYVDSNDPTPAGYDYIIEVDKSIRTLTGDDLSGVPFTTHTIPSRMSMMHRIRMAPDGNLWFTEMMTDKLGKIALPARA